MNEKQQSESEHMFASNSHLACDEELLRFYLVVCPDMARPVARALAEGNPPREVLAGGQFSPLLIEWVVQDMLRKNVAEFQKQAAA